MNHKVNIVNKVYIFEEIWVDGYVIMINEE